MKYQAWETSVYLKWNTMKYLLFRKSKCGTEQLKKKYIQKKLQLLSNFFQQSLELFIGYMKPINKTYKKLEQESHQSSHTSKLVLTLIIK